jgi:hypothetical protein
MSFFGVALKGKWDLEDFYQRTQEDLRRKFNHVGLRAVAKAKKLAPVNTGMMRSRITHEVRWGNDLEYHLRVFVPVKAKNGFPYPLAVEKGTKPHRPPFKALERWAHLHGMPTGAIVRHIEMYGTKAHPFLRPAVEQALKELRW